MKYFKDIHSNFIAAYEDDDKWNVEETRRNPDYKEISEEEVKKLRLEKKQNNMQ